ncbi:Tn7-like element transposition protein TnsE [Vibrio sp. RC27]
MPLDEKTNESVSVGNAVQGGNSQEFDFGLNRGEDDDDSHDLIEAEPTEKFRLFERTVEIIKTKKGFSVQGVRCGSFPPPKNGSRMVFKTDDGELLRYHMANISYLNIGAVIIEVDVDSLMKPKNVSTLVVTFSESSNPEQVLKTILQDYSDLGLSWNHAWITKNTAVSKFCRHPKKTKKENDVDRRITADEYVNAWAGILCGKLRGIQKLSGD